MKLTHALAAGAFLLTATPVLASEYGMEIFGPSSGDPMAMQTWDGAGLEPTIYTAKGNISFNGTDDTSCEVDWTIIPATLPTNDESNWLQELGSGGGISFVIPTGQLNQTYDTCPDAGPKGNVYNGHTSTGNLHSVGTVEVTALVGDGEVEVDWFGVEQEAWAFIMDFSNTAGTFKTEIGGQMDYQPPNSSYTVYMAGFSGDTLVPGPL